MNRIINFYQRAKRKLLYIKNNYSFHINNYVTNLIYGNVPIKYYKFNTSEEDTEELKKIILNSKELDFLEDEEVNFRFYKRKRKPSFFNGKRFFISQTHGIPQAESVHCGNVKTR